MILKVNIKLESLKHDNKQIGEHPRASHVQYRKYNYSTEVLQTCGIISSSCKQEEHVVSQPP